MAASTAFNQVVTDREGNPEVSRSSVIGMRLFLASLTMLFGASMLGYIIIRNNLLRGGEGAALHLPVLLWLSTVVVVFTSYTYHRAVKAVEADQQATLRFWLWVSLIGAVVFLVVQAPAMVELLRTHRQYHDATATAVSPMFALYGLVFFFILLHALHIIGGIIWTAHVARQAALGRYGPQNPIAVRHAALYWHFLDIVWIVMFGTMLIVG